MSDYDRTLELVEAAQNSTGKSQEQFDKTTDTVTYRINTLKNTWEQLRLTFLDSDTLKNALDVLNKILDAISNFDTSQFIELGAIGLTLGRSVVSNFIDALKHGSVAIVSTFNDIGDKVSASMVKKASGLGGRISNWAQNKRDHTNLTVSERALTKQYTQTEEFFSKESIKNLKDSISQQMSTAAQEVTTPDTAAYEAAVKDKKKEYNGKASKKKWDQRAERWARNQINESDYTLPAVSQGAVDITTEYVAADQELKILSQDLANIKKEQAEISAEIEKAVGSKKTELQTQEALLKQEEQRTEWAAQKATQDRASAQAKASELSNEEAEFFAQQKQKSNDSAVPAGATFRTPYTQKEKKEGQSAAFKDSTKTAAKQAGSAAIGTAITTALVMAISGADFVDTIKAAGISALTAAIPVIMQYAAETLIPKVIKWITTAVGGTTAAIATAIVAAVAIAIYAWQKWIDSVQEASNSAREAEIERLNKIEDKNKELEKEVSTSISHIQQNTKSYTSFEEDYDRFQYLSDKNILSESEKSELSDLFESITSNEDYQDLILAYDEEEESIRFVNDALDTYKETIEEANEAELQNVKSAENEQIANYQFAVSKYGEFTTAQGILENQTLSGQETDTSYGDINDYLEGILNLPDELKEAIGSSVIGLDKTALTTLSGTEEGVQALEEIMDEQGITFTSILAATEEQSSILKQVYKEQLEDEVQQMQSNIYQSTLVSESGEYVSQEIADMLANAVVPSDYKSMYKDADWEISAAGFGSRNIDVERIIGMDTTYWQENLGFSQEGVEAVETTLSTLGNLSQLVVKTGTNPELKELDDLKGQGGIMEDFYNWVQEDTERAKNYNNARVRNEDIDVLLQEYLADLASRSLGIDEDKTISTDFYQKYQDLFDQYQTQLVDDAGKYTQAELQSRFQALADKFGELGDEGQIAADALLNTLKENQSTWTEQDNELKKYRIDQSVLDVMTTGAKTTLQQMFSALSASFSDNQLASLGATLNNYLTNLDTFNIDESLADGISTILTGINFTQDTATLKANMDTAIDEMVNLGIDRVDAEKLINSYINDGAKILQSIPTTAEAIKNEFETILTNIKTIKDNFKDAMGVVDNLFANGELTTDDIDTLVAAGYEDIFDFDDNLNIKIDTDAIVGKMEDQIQANIDDIEMQTESLLNEKNFLEDNMDDFDLSSLSTTLQETILQQAKDQGLALDKKALNNFASSQDIQGMLDTFSAAGGTAYDLGVALNETMDTTNGLTAAELYNIVEQIGLQGSANAAAEALGELADLSQDKKDIIAQYYAKAALEEYEAALEEQEQIQEEYNDKVEEETNKREDIAKKEKEIEELGEDVNDKLQEWQESIHGTQDYDSGIDGLRNFTNAIEETTSKIEDLEDALEDSTTAAEATANYQELNTQLNTKNAQTLAKQGVLSQAMGNLQSVMQQQYGDWVSFDSEGNLLVDFGFEDADMPDAMKDGLKNMIDKYDEYNEYYDSCTDDLKEISDKRKEIYEDTYKNISDEEDKIIEILKEKDEEAISEKKEYYEALKEADDDYINALQEAIEKQRNLRDQQNQYEDLATKEKKLALLSRDTSGANQKDVLSLQDEVEEDRQTLLDNEVDNLIDSLQDLYEKEQELRDTEIESMEAVTESATMYVGLMQQVMSTWQTEEDRTAWYLANDPDAQDLSVEQTENYINENASGWSAIVNYQALLASQFEETQQNSNEAATEMMATTSEDITVIADELLASAEEAAKEAQEEAYQAYEDAQESLADAQKELDELNDDLNDIVKEEDDLYEKSQNLASEILTLQETTQDALIASAAIASEEAQETIIDAWCKGLNVDEATARGLLSDYINNQESTSQVEYAETTVIDNNFSSATGNEEARKGVIAAKRSDTGLDSLKNTGGKEPKRYRVTYHTRKGQNARANEFIYGDNLNTLKKWIEEKGYYGVLVQDISERPGETWESLAKKDDLESFGSRYATGGLVDYTGPAWVDGTKSNPEAFLSAEDTQRIGEAAQLLASLPIFNSTASANNAQSTTVGDTAIEININVESISSDYDVDDMIERVRQDIVDVANPVGVNTILTKKI